MRVTRVRASFMAASRRHNHGDPQGVIKNGIFRNVENWVRRQGPNPTSVNPNGGKDKAGVGTDTSGATTTGTIE
jgi:hypothetical protein